MTSVTTAYDQASTGWFPDRWIDEDYELYHTDAFDWLCTRRANSIHAVVTDPPYGLLEYRPDQLHKRRMGKGGVWRIPPAFDGHKRIPVPRFTVLGDSGESALRGFFDQLASELLRMLVPGGHILIATNPLVSHFVYNAFLAVGFEKRGEIIRLVTTLRGGDRPKGAHLEYPDISVMPRASWEPWGLFRKPCEGRVQDNLKKWKTGGLRRPTRNAPFRDVIEAAPARGIERRLAPHPSLKPQYLMRQLVHAALPLGEGVILDPFMGSGSTIAAAKACGLKSVGLEADSEYFSMAIEAIPNLAALSPKGKQRGSN